MTVVLLLLGRKAFGWLGVIGTLFLQGTLALGLYLVLVVSSGLWY